MSDDDDDTSPGLLELFLIFGEPSPALRPYSRKTPASNGDGVLSASRLGQGNINASRAPGTETSLPNWSRTFMPFIPRPATVVAGPSYGLYSLAPSHLATVSPKYSACPQMQSASSFPNNDAPFLFDGEFASVRGICIRHSDFA